ncbi:MAG: efflux RND transporter periplasmic adaptor subunit [Neomegalonema sp.]|nr:efflux RND transporter periplasmic adaptor subunit [Neomegalonema sp.]
MANQSAANQIDQAQEPTAPRASGAVLVQSRLSEAQTLENRLLLRGVTQAARNVEVKAQTGGLVISRPLRKGAQVREGELLCEIDLGDRNAQLKQAQATLAKARADATASSTLSRKGYSTGVEVATDQAALAGAQAAIETIELDIERTRITAPFDGLLESDTAETGSLLLSGSTCATVIALNPIHVVGYAPERSIDQVSLGAPAHVRLITGRSFEAEVSFVARAADPATRTFLVEAIAPNTNGLVRDGMSAEMSIGLEDDQAHLLPHSVLTLDDDGRLGVRIVEREDGTSLARFVPVELLRDGADGVWLAGLPPRAEIITVGQEFVTDGARVSALPQGETRP